MTLPDIYTPTARKALTPKQRMQLFIDRKGTCCLCGNRIDGTREAWIDEHIIPLADGGGNELDNRGVAHEKCARVKTSRENVDRAHLRRAAEAHFGAKRRTGFPTNRSGPFKKKMNGQVVKR